MQNIDAPLLSSDPKSIKVRMSPAERARLERLIAKAQFYLEFGSGGSTELAIALGCRKILSVESSAEWIEQMSEKPAVREALASRQLTFEYIDVGPVRAWGFPRNNSQIRNWPEYYLRPFIKYEWPFDFILIDGRFRKACAYASWAFIKEKAIVAIHDYTHRDDLSEIEKFFNVEESIDSLIVLSKKQKVLPQTFFSSVLKDMLDPA